MNQDTKTKPSDEFAAIQKVYSELEPLAEEARVRVVKYIVSLFGIGAHLNLEPSSGAVDDEEAETPAMSKGSSGVSSVYGEFADLYDAADPKTNADKALIAGYWLQECVGAENFTAQSANTELKHLGHGLANDTVSIDSLKKMKPALALQLKKSGKSQQARKTYKITTAGVKQVQEMVSG